MDIKVKSLYLKMSPFKVRPVLYGLRGKNVMDAFVALKFTNKKGARLMLALLKSAMAIGKENDLENEKLYIKSVNCGEGPRLKRRQIKARGRSDAITKRMCHLNLVISDTAIENKKQERNANNTDSELKVKKTETESIKMEKNSKSKITNNK